MVTRQEVARARDDLAAFAAMVGWPMETWQSEALSLRTRQTVLVSPRQCGKSRSLAVLACWRAFRKPKQLILIISAGETAAGRLLRAVRDVAAHPLLHASVDDETKTWVILTNGSEIRSVPASDAQVRGWSVDTLIVDEAAFVPEDLLASAALPTTAARPLARIVLASTPWGDSGMFWSMAQQGLEPGNDVTATYKWRLKDAWWIVPEVIEAARQTLSPLRFRAEYEGEWVPSGDAYFDRADLLAATCSFPLMKNGSGMPATGGADWGRQADAHAAVLAGLLDDYGINSRPVVIVPWCETSRRSYALQVAEWETLGQSWQLTVYSETTGVGAFPSEQLAQKMPRSRVIGVPATQRGKEDAYGRVAALLSERSLVLPDHEELLRQMGGVSAAATPGGGLKIGARLESIHDDLPDALSLAVGNLPRHLADVPRRAAPDGIRWAETPAGLMVPVPFGLLAAEASWLGVNGPVTRCPSCSLCYPAYKEACQFCGAANPEPPAAKVHVITTLGPSDEAAVPAGNYWNPDLMRCGNGHLFDGKLLDRCAQCHGSQRTAPNGQGGSAMLGLPSGIGSRLGMLTGRR